jgi:protoporphyrinogen oxidase
VLEKEPEVGGLCRSITSNGFAYDYTGHLLHASDPYVSQLVDQLVGLSTFNYIPRSSFIYSHGVYTKYPFQVNLRGLPAAVIADCIDGFVKRKNIRDPKTFYSWVLKNFGVGFARHFFIPYQEKLFCCDAQKFSAQWTGRFVPQTSLQDIIAGALGVDESPVGYNAHFYYPKSGGIAVLPQGLARNL